MEETAFFGHRDHGQRIWAAIRGDGGAL